MNRVRIEIDTKTFVRFWLVVIGFGFAILALYSARTALLILGVSLFLAIALNGPVSRLARHLPDRNRMLSTALSFLVVILLLGFVMFLVVPPIVDQTAHFIDAAPGMIGDMSSQWKGLGDFIEKYNLQAQIDQAIKSVQDDAGKWAAGFGTNFLSGLGSLFSLAAATILVLVLTFLMLIEGPNWMKRIWGLYRDNRQMQYHRRVVGRMTSVVGGYVAGQLTVSGIGALCTGAVVFVLSQVFTEIPPSLALPPIAIAFTLSLIPMFGATIAGAIIALLIAFSNIPAAIIFVIYFIVYQQIENNFISPAIQAKHIDLTPLMVLAAVTVGLYMFGILGGIISIPIAGCIKVLVDEYISARKRSRHAVTETASKKPAKA